MSGTWAQITIDLAWLVLVLAPAAALLATVAFVPGGPRAWRQAVRPRPGRDWWLLAGLPLLLLPEVLQSRLDPWATAALPPGWHVAPTASIAALEGSWHVALQRVQPPAVVGVMTWTYFIGYPFLLLAGVWVPWVLGAVDAARRALAAYVACYAMALPFYVLVPVDEVWHYDGAVVNLMAQHPWVMQHLYSFNELNNSFPSLHTAASAAVAACVWRSPGLPRRLRWGLLGLAVPIILSTMYLGIHWGIDVVAGLAVAGASLLWVEARWPTCDAAPRATLKTEEAA